MLNEIRMSLDDVLIVGVEEGDVAPLGHHQLALLGGLGGGGTGESARQGAGGAGDGRALENLSAGHFHKRPSLPNGRIVLVSGSRLCVAPGQTIVGTEGFEWGSFIGPSPLPVKHARSRRKPGLPDETRPCHNRSFTADVVVIGGGVNGSEHGVSPGRAGSEARGAGGAAAPGRRGLRQVGLPGAHALHQRARVPAGPREPQGLPRLEEPGGRRLRLRARRLPQAGAPAAMPSGWRETSPRSRRSASIPAWSRPRKCARSFPAACSRTSGAAAYEAGFGLSPIPTRPPMPSRKPLGGREPRSSRTARRRAS